MVLVSSFARVKWPCKLSPTALASSVRSRGAVPVSRKDRITATPLVPSSLDNANSALSNMAHPDPKEMEHSGVVTLIWDHPAVLPRPTRAAEKKLALTNVFIGQS